MKTLVDSLKLYFQNNSRNQIIKDWNEYEIYDEVGVTVDDFLHQSNLLYEIENECSYWQFTSINKKIENPEFAPDFLFKNIIFVAYDITL